MLTRVRRKISKQMNHENDFSAVKPEKPEESQERKHSTVERKQSRAERKRSAAEKKHVHSLDKSLTKSSESNAEVEYLMYETVQGLQAEVNALRNQLEEQTKRSQELKKLKTQQVCALTFKLASAIRLQEKAEENAARAMAEMERFQQSKVTPGNSCHVNAIMSFDESEEPGKFRKLSEESGKLQDERHEEGNCHVSDDDNCKSYDRTGTAVTACCPACCRKTGIIFSQNELQTMMERREESLCNDSGYYSFNAENDASSVKLNQHDAETQTLVQERDTSVVDVELQGNTATRQANQELVPQELSRMKEELGEVKSNMSMMRALNQRLSKDLQNFTETYERLQGGWFPCRDKGSKREQTNDNRAEDQLSRAVTLPQPVAGRHYESDVVDLGICEPHAEVEKLETFEEKVTYTQVADVNLAESEREKPSDEDDCASTMEHHCKVCMPQEVKVSQEVEKETLGDSKRKTKPGLRQVKGWEELKEDAVLHSTKEKQALEVATVHQMELLKEQLKTAMMEIDALRLDNSDIKRELKNISTSTGSELLLKTSKFTYSSAGGKYPVALEPDNCGSETEEVSPPKTVTLVQCPYLSAQPKMLRTVQCLEPSSRPSLPTETSDDVTERPKKQDHDEKQMCAQDPPIHHSSAPVSSSFVLKRRYQRPVLKEEPSVLSSCVSDRLGFNRPILASSKGAFVAPDKLAELEVCSGSSVQLVERKKSGFPDEERSKPLDFSRAKRRQSGLLPDARKPLFMQYTNDYIQRHIVRSSDYIAKLRDLKPEELDRPQED